MSDVIAMDRQARDRVIDNFLDGAGWGAAVRAPLAGDASARAYQRLAMGPRRAVLMDSPTDNVNSFVVIARHLIQLGYSAPEIYAADATHGLVLLEDLGDVTYGRALADHLVPERRLYERAVDLLADLHLRQAPEALPADLPVYDAAAMQERVDLLLDWYWPAVVGDEPSDQLRESYQQAWSAPLSWVAQHGPALVLRDFMIDNLMWLDDRPGLSACGLLDFQDASVGSPVYDLVSLLHDVRRNIDPVLVADMRARYADKVAGGDQMLFAPDTIDKAFAILGAQRQTRIIGVFTRLCVRDGKPGYLDFMPRVWRLLHEALRHPELASVNAWFDEHLPPNLRKTPYVK